MRFKKKQLSTRWKHLNYLLSVNISILDAHGKILQMKMPISLALNASKDRFNRHVKDEFEGPKFLLMDALDTKKSGIVNADQRLKGILPPTACCHQLFVTS